MSGFSPVIEAIGTFAGFAAEGEKIKLIAVSILTMGTDRFDVFVHGGKGFGVLGWRGNRGGRHDE